MPFAFPACHCSAPFWRSIPRCADSAEPLPAFGASEGRGATSAATQERTDLQARHILARSAFRTRIESAEPPTLLDPNPHAVPCNSGQYREQKSRCLSGICKPVQRSATTDRTLVMSRKAVRVRSSALFFSCKTSRNEKPTMLVSEALSAVDYYPEAPSIPSAVYLPMLGVASACSGSLLRCLRGAW
jgi:hypothetical protein